MNKWAELIIGLILVVGIVYAAWGIPVMSSWGSAAVEFFKGGVVWFAVMIGLLFILLGISDLKD